MLGRNDVILQGLVELTGVNAVLPFGMISYAATDLSANEFLLANTNIDGGPIGIT